MGRKGGCKIERIILISDLIGFVSWNWPQTHTDRHRQLFYRPSTPIKKSVYVCVGPWLNKIHRNLG